MTSKRWLAISMALVMAAGIVVFVILPTSIEIDGVGLMVIVAAFGITGLALVWRVPGNRIGWIYLAAGVLGGIDLATHAYIGVAIERGWPMVEEVAKVSDAIYFPWIFTMVSVPALLFPDGRLPSRRWRWLAWTIGLLYPVSVVAFVTGPGFTEDIMEGRVNPWEVDALAPIFNSPIWEAVTMLWLGLALLGPAAALITRFRRSDGVERLQMKWLALSASIAVAGLGVTYALGGEGPAWLQIATTIGLLGVLAIPITTGMAIVRYRLYEIDRLISRTLTYGFLAGLLGAVYAAGVFLVGTLATDEGIGVALSTLAVAALFNPLRRWLQRIIDRHFSRGGYDAREVLDDFSQKVSDQVDVDELVDDLLDVVDETVVPAEAAVWVRERGEIR